jgi:hypothetical protein
MSKPPTFEPTGKWTVEGAFIPTKDGVTYVDLREPCLTIEYHYRSPTWWKRLWWRITRGGPTYIGLHTKRPKGR